MIRIIIISVLVVSSKGALPRKPHCGAGVSRVAIPDMVRERFMARVAENMDVRYSRNSGIQQPRLVYPRLLEERSADGRMVMHLHDQLTLNLRKASVAARNFRVLEHEDGREVTHFFNGKDIEKDLHEDEKQFATVHVTRRDSGVEVEGVVGPYHRIEPMPEMERSDDGLIPHMIHEIEKKEMVDIEMAPGGKGKRSEYGHPDIAYLMTGNDVYSEQNGKKSMNVLGIGFVGGLCTDFYVALGEDNAGLYTGMHTLTHEAGHV
ncbi:hypothetical protein HPB49_019806 [Dermacentor silvarum]|uniref:Uncharacterized protein n=1 Tax=Dermacentor silvarum TaxID=543639 RepID=A0ACB8C5F1_DERSI|nr:hypothetical protein HPB49_019806 [Dermacentor silvarum]